MWKNDLPEWLEPMTIKELRQGLRRSVFVVPFLAVQCFAVIAIAMEFYRGYASTDTKGVGILNLSLMWTSGDFWKVASAICLLGMPLCGVRLMRQELEDGNHELLLLTKLDRWKVVLGKFILLWGMCVLTFVSLMPYIVVRYLVGGVEWGHEAACAGTVLGGSAMLCAGAIGASAFQKTAVSVGVLGLFIVSMLGACGVSLVFMAAVSGGCGWWYHFNAVAAVFGYSSVGLALARSRLRLSVQAYEVNPSSTILGLMVFAPFVIGLVTAMTCGYGGGFTHIALGWIALRTDQSFKALAWKRPPPPNVP